MYELYNPWQRLLLALLESVSGSDGGRRMTRPWMTVRHCRMRLDAIEEVLGELIIKINELHEELEKIVKEDE